MVKKERIIMRRITASLICALCVVSVGAGMVSCMPSDEISETFSSIGTPSANTGTASDPPQTSAAASEQTEPSKPQEENTTNPTIDEPTLSPLEDSRIVWAADAYEEPSATLWKGKNIPEKLWVALNQSEEDAVFAIHVSIPCDNQYIYKGKSIAEYETDAYYESIREQSKDESEALNEAQKAYREACDACLDENVQKMQRVLTDRNIQNEKRTFDVIDYYFPTVHLFFFATKEQFGDLSFAGVGINDESLTFTLASKDMYNGVFTDEN